MNSNTNSKPLPIGVDKFEKLRTIDYYYVDKTQLIKELLQNRAEVTLFTRPRRFGKTLNMRMLQSFFEIGSKPELFKGLAIANEKELCAQHRGKYPVVFISLKRADGLDFNRVYIRLCATIRAEVFRLGFLKNSNKIADEEKVSFRRLLHEEETRDDIESSLWLLTKLLYLHYGQKAILLIDEYDVPLDKDHNCGYYREMVDLIRSMFGQALKSNDYLEFAVLTGCMRVSKESIFTGLNNLKVHSITDAQFDEYFGFTDDEVQTMLDYYGLQEHYSAVKEWYDGYRFGKEEVYCPWDVLNYCYDILADNEIEPQAYWLNSSGNDIIRRLIDKADTASEQQAIEDLMAGRPLYKKLNLQLTHNEIDKNIDNIWSLLFMSGYLTTTGNRAAAGYYELVIPNKEVLQIYQEQVLDWFKDKISADRTRLTDLFNAFATGQAVVIQTLLNKELLTAISFYDANESFYHGFLLALLNACIQWRAKSNAEAGRGRSDILVESRDRQLGMIIEVKYAKASSDEKELQTVCQQALQQIVENNYAAFLQASQVPDIWLYGITFYRKQCLVLAQKLGWLPVGKLE